MNNVELIERARARINRHMAGDRLCGDVGAAVVAADGRVHTGVCVDTASTGYCAEVAALAAMINDGQYVFRAIVAVWIDPDTGQTYVLPPCGKCREFMRQIDAANLDADIVLGLYERVPLRELLPRHAWPQALD